MVTGLYRANRSRANRVWIIKEISERVCWEYYCDVDKHGWANCEPLNVGPLVSELPDDAAHFDGVHYRVENTSDPDMFLCHTYTDKVELPHLPDRLVGRDWFEKLGITVK